MRTITVLSRKGGAGKTTVAVSLALAARQAGLKAIVADIDPLHSAAEVLRDRQEAERLLVETAAAKLFILGEVSRKQGVDLLIIDTPVAPEADIVLAMNASDLCLAIARPSPLDIAAVMQSVAVMRRIGAPGMVVLNQCPPARNGEEHPVVQRALEALRFGGVPTMDTRLRARTAYQQAFAQHCGVTEWDPQGEAAGDVLGLLAEIADLLLLPEAEDGFVLDMPEVADLASPVRQLQARLKAL
jgi:chromosome partitioning protein